MDTSNSIPLEEPISKKTIKEEVIKLIENILIVSFSSYYYLYNSNNLILILALLLYNNSLRIKFTTRSYRTTIGI